MNYAKRETNSTDPVQHRLFTRRMRATCGLSALLACLILIIPTKSVQAQVSTTHEPPSCEADQLNIITDPNWTTLNQGVDLSVFGEQNTEQNGGWTGVEVERTTDNKWKISAVAANGPGCFAGLRVGDIVETINSRQVRDLPQETMRSAFSRTAGRTVQIGVRRGLEVMQIGVRSVAPTTAAIMLPDMVRQALATSFGAISAPDQEEFWPILADLYACNSDLQSMNEFERQRARADIVSRWRTMPQELAQTRTIFLPITLLLGEYNFGSGSFPVVGTTHTPGSVAVDETKMTIQNGWSSGMYTILSEGLYLSNSRNVEDARGYWRSNESNSVTSIIVSAPFGSRCGVDGVRQGFSSSIIENSVVVSFASRTKGLSLRENSNLSDRLGNGSSRSPSHILLPTEIVVDPNIAEKMVENSRNKNAPSLRVYYVIEGQVERTVSARDFSLNRCNDCEVRKDVSLSAAPIVLVTPIGVRTFNSEWKEISSVEARRQ
jgi:membrane-associated protease RseP (regulator of RpoE activity)